jgi:hypothetical protein
LIIQFQFRKYFMKPIQSLFILAFVILSLNSVSAQYGNGYNNGYGNSYGGRGGGMGMDRSMMQGPQSSPSKPKE